MQDHFKEPSILNTRKRKKVTFGEDLTPEVFDESLPANSPLCKGGTPVCKKNLGNISRLLLEQSSVPEHLPQPNFDDKGENLVSGKCGPILSFSSDHYYFAYFEIMEWTK